MIIRIVKMTFRKEKTNDFLDIFHQSKEKIRGFEGCHHLELLNDRDSTNVFFTYSYWESEQCLENYRHSPLFKTTWSKTKVLFDAKPEAWSLEQQVKL